MAFASVLFGDVFRAFNPWRAGGRVPAPRRAPRAYPERLGVWPAAAALLIFTWIELASGWGEHPPASPPPRSPTRVLTWAGDGVVRRRDLDPPRRGVRVYFNLLWRLSIFEQRGREVGVRPLLGGLPPLERPPGPSPSSR